MPTIVEVEFSIKKFFVVINLFYRVGSMASRWGTYPKHMATYVCPGEGGVLTPSHNPMDPRMLFLICFEMFKGFLSVTNNCR